MPWTDFVLGARLQSADCAPDGRRLPSNQPPLLKSTPSLSSIEQPPRRVTLSIPSTVSKVIYDQGSHDEKAPRRKRLMVEFASSAETHSAFCSPHQASPRPTSSYTTMVQVALLTAALAATAASVSAHPGQHHERSLVEMSNSQLFRANAHRSLAACAGSKHMRELEERAAARRLASIQELRAERRRLAAADVIATSHKSNLTGVTPTEFNAATLFGSSPKCLLEPEVTQGPYYVNGELIRNDVRETQPGVDLYTELQFIDINTCTPVPDYYVDFWHCNSTGVYAGVVAGGNGNQADLTNINNTFARGLYPTDADGLVQFVTKFPGHYTGRATHIHILGSHGGSVLANNTYASTGTSSVGQIFFDQDLITEVEKTGVYATNTQPLTTNAADGIFGQEAASGFDAVVNYVYLGEKVEEGLFSWISVGVDTTISKAVGAAATWTANGGVANAGGAGGPPGGGPPGGRPTRTPSQTTL